MSSENGIKNNIYFCFFGFVLLTIWDEDDKIELKEMRGSFFVKVWGRAYFSYIKTYLEDI